MSTYLTSKRAIFAILAALAVVAGFIGFQYATSKTSLGSLLGLSPKNGALASAVSCDLPSANKDDVYFVSCGGFF